MGKCLGFAAGVIAAATARERYPEVVVLGWTGESQRASTPRSPVQEPKCDVWTPPQLLEFFDSQILPLCCVSQQVALKRPRKTCLSSLHVQLGCLVGRVGESAGRKIRYVIRTQVRGRLGAISRFLFACVLINLLLSFFFLPLIHQQKSKSVKECPFQKAVMYVQSSTPLSPVTEGTS